MLNNIKKKWAELDPKKQKKITLLSICIFMMIFCALGWHSRSKHKIQRPGQNIQESKKTKSIDLNTRLIKESLITETRNRINQQDKILHDLKEEMKLLSQEKDSYRAAPDLKTEHRPLPVPRPPGLAETKAAPPQIISSPPVFSQSGFKPPENPEDLIIGGITTVSNDTPVKQDAGDDKKKLKIYLPPSFMEATLLSGVRAPTTSAGKNNPLPILFRIKNLAILPNKVKGDLKGCFVIGEGTGNLADERVHVRLLTLSCVSKKGTAVIDQQIKGFVMDEDGIIGLDGTVVAKMGSMLARSALAGALGGIGEAMQNSSFDYQTTALGTQQIFSQDDTTNITRGAVGGAISGASKDLQKFYLQLAEQTMPIVEVGATKTVTLVISEGINLEVKEANILH
ncbi:MAG: TraB/VirB10 family protein [Desulfosarcina sp.]|nr:TraB/VirB10 family protein [Desulfobacterales bacterium]